MKKLWVLPLATAFIVNVAQAETDREKDSLDEVMVTAQRRAESLQAIPMAVTALTPNMLHDLGISRSVDLANALTGLVIGNPGGQGNQPSIYMRGIGLDDLTSNNSSPIAIYMDDAYVSAISAQNFLLFDLERVEVLKGPQGTLYGRNTTGGAIRFLTAKPGPDFGGFTRLRYGRFGSLETEAALSVPVSDVLQFRVAGIVAESNGFVRNLVNDRKHNENDSRGWRASLRFTPTSSYDMDLQVFGGKTDTRSPLYKHFGTQDPNSFDPDSQLFVSRCDARRIRAGQCVDQFGYAGENGEHYSGTSERPGELAIRMTGGIATQNLALNDSLVLTAVTSYMDVSKHHGEDSDASPTDMLYVTYGVKQETFTQELRLTYTGNMVEAVVGAYYLYDKVHQDNWGDIYPELRRDMLAFGFDAMSVIEAHIFQSRHRNTQKTSSYALFGQIDHKITPDLNATLGLRFTDEKRRFRTAVDLMEPINMPGALIDGMGGEHYERISNQNLSFRAGLDYRVTPEMMIYGNVSTAFKSGGFNGGFLFEPSELEFVSYGPEKITAVHLGFKSDWFNQSLRFNGEVFYYDYDDMQVFTLIDIGGPVPLSILANAAKARMKGFDAAIGAIPAKGLYLSAAVTYLDAEFRKFQSAGRDFSGNRPPMSPKWSMVARASYEHAVTDAHKLRLQSDLRWQDDVYFHTSNAPEMKQNGYAIWNAQLSLLPVAENWELAAWVRNITNKAHWSYFFDTGESFGVLQGMFGMPRTYGLELRVNF